MNKMIFRKLIDVKEALGILYKNIQINSLTTEEVNITKANGRILGEDIFAHIDLPPFSRAIVDGFAVRAIDTAFASESNPKKLKIKDRISTGQQSNFIINQNECIEIDTGAILPKGADAVVRVEVTSYYQDEVVIYDSVSEESGIAKKGSDVYNGQLILNKGEELTPEKIGVLASLGYKKINVIKKPRIAIFSTGNELINPGKKLETSQIYDVNQFVLGALVQNSGCTAQYNGILKDKLEEIRKGVSSGIQNADAVILTGGTSAGSSDLTYKIFNGLGSPGLLVHGISAKPGKPTIIAALNNKPVFGLPGFPVSALVLYNLIVDPVLRKMSGKKTESKKEITANLATRFISQRGRKEYVPIFIKRKGKKKLAVPILKDSGAIGSLVTADGIIEINKNIDILEKNETVKIKLFPKVQFADLIAVGDINPISNLVLDELKKDNINVRSNFRGLYHGIPWIRDEIADLLVVCSTENNLGLNLENSYNLINLGNYIMKMVLASPNKEIFYEGAKFALPPKSSALRRYAESYILKMIKDYEIIETWSYAASKAALLNKSATSALLPFYEVSESNLHFFDAFNMTISHLIRKEMLLTKIGQRLQFVIKKILKN